MFLFRKFPDCFLLAAPMTYPGWEETFTEQGGSKRSNGYPDCQSGNFCPLEGEAWT